MNRIKKLTLKKETVSLLTGNEMNQVKGGTGTLDAAYSCDYPNCGLVALTAAAIYSKMACPPPPNTPCCNTGPCTSDTCGCACEASGYEYICGGNVGSGFDVCG